tara:strand:+ start:73 stop:525 length:453 start_codon:yes stop_codon:yes gene_type:complete
MAEIQEFIAFHGLDKDLGHKIQQYVGYAFSVTKGINVEGLASQLPAHLQLEVYLQLHRSMVTQVSIFDGSTDEFYCAIVMKLVPSITIAGDYVFYKGERGERMYFIKRGRAQVRVEGTIVHTFNDSGYFGELHTHHYHVLCLAQCDHCFH